MPQYINVTITNDTAAQHVYFATDDVMHQPAPVTAADGTALGAQFPLGPGEVATAQLVVSDDGHGHGTGGYPGNSLTKIDLNDGDSLYP